MSEPLWGGSTLAGNASYGVFTTVKWEYRDNIQVQVGPGVGLAVGAGIGLVVGPGAGLG